MTVRTLATSEGVSEPLPRALAAVLRRATLDHLRAECRRGYPPLLHVGFPGGHEEVFALRPGDPSDHAIRADVLAAMLQRVRRVAGAVPLVWLTRAGPLDLQDVDAAWLSSARTAAGEAGIGLTMVVVTKRGWFDPRSGVRREWKRLRDRSGGNR
ncbi:hypothetical protein GCM10027062_31100 [Nocardioides hungaricus]